MFQKTICILHAFFLISCVEPSIYKGQLPALDKGITKSEVAIRLKQAPIATYLLTRDDREFEFHEYRLSDGMQVDLYLLAYEKDQLLYWGYINEFQRNSDQTLSRVIADFLSINR